MTLDDLKFPAKEKTIYSVNDGNYTTWDDAMKRAVDKFKFNTPKPYTARYVGSMVADVHRTLLYGGVYMYPADKAKGNGKLRVLYEGFPMAFIIEAAGGQANTGMFKGSLQRILDIVPTVIHEKCPVICGSTRDVQRVLSEYD
jgi:fructose-1,6-bisphosphatase I